MEQNKQEIIGLLNSTGREGMDKLVSYLQKHDYFSAPASTKYHLCCMGGLAQHSLNVYYNLMRLFYGDGWKSIVDPVKRPDYPVLFEGTDNEVEHENIIIVALLHDLCKVDSYKVVNRNVKEDGAWKEIQVYEFDEQIPILGHGTKSVVVAQQFIRLYLPELQAISFHMGNQDSDKVFSSTVSGVFKTCRLALFIHLADCRATFVEDEDSVRDPSLAPISDDSIPF